MRPAHSRQETAGPIDLHKALFIPVALVAVCLLWSLCYPLIALTALYGMPLFTASARAFGAGLIVLTTARFARAANPPRRYWPHVIAIGCGSTGLGFAGMFLAGGELNPGMATILSNTQP